ncbi:hypothetical protein BU16DRAFT_556062 [Lophium mytilinum]|uniref:F-box domain-containing protein n=1 Tax=Lophium mytilinum TaxID=390894 RepID=A0A6A6RB43_9PEZI|nr:hypothetical protein BU16DRAFT_556062 [Lophium mytilinum]
MNSSPPARLLELPEELQDRIILFLRADFISLKLLRETCKQLARIAARHVFETVHIGLFPDSLEWFIMIAKTLGYAKFVKELVFFKDLPRKYENQEAWLNALSIWNTRWYDPNKGAVRQAQVEAQDLTAYYQRCLVYQEASAQLCECCDDHINSNNPMLESLNGFSSAIEKMTNLRSACVMEDFMHAFWSTYRKKIAISPTEWRDEGGNPPIEIDYERVPWDPQHDQQADWPNFDQSLNAKNKIAKIYPVFEVLTSLHVQMRYRAIEALSNPVVELANVVLRAKALQTLALDVGPDCLIYAGRSMDTSPDFNILNHLLYDGADNLRELPWPQLKNLTLGKFYTPEDTLFRFLHLLAPNLRGLYLAGLTFPKNQRSWKSFVSKLPTYLSLDYVRLDDLGSLAKNQDGFFPGPNDDYNVLQVSREKEFGLDDEDDHDCHWEHVQDYLLRRTIEMPIFNRFTFLKDGKGKCPIRGCPLSH